MVHVNGTRYLLTPDAGELDLKFRRTVGVRAGADDAGAVPVGASPAIERVSPSLSRATLGVALATDGSERRC